MGFGLTDINWVKGHVKLVGLSYVRLEWNVMLTQLYSLASHALWGRFIGE